MDILACAHTADISHLPGVIGVVWLDIRRISVLLELREENATLFRAWIPDREMRLNVLHIVLSHLLAMLLLLPTAVEAYHNLDHKHPTLDCTHLETHLHKDNLDCSLDDLHLSPFNYSFLTPDLEITPSPDVLQNFAALSATEQDNHFTQRDRGPPAAV